LDGRLPRSLYYAARRALNRRERKSRAAPVGMTVRGVPQEARHGGREDRIRMGEPKTQAHNPCLGHPASGRTDRRMVGKGLTPEGVSYR